MAVGRFVTSGAGPLGASPNVECPCASSTQDSTHDRARGTLGWSRWGDEILRRSAPAPPRQRQTRSSPAADGRLGTALEADGRVDAALARGRPRLRCQRIQPLERAGAARPCYEIFLSVSGPRGRPIPTGRFVQEAEQCGQMPSVDRWVVRQSFAWIAGNRRIFSDTAGLSLNLSGQSLDDPSLAEFLEREMRRRAIDPALIAFEITETSPIRNMAQARAHVREIRSKGSRIALDSYGAGGSCDRYLGRLPLDIVKIDATLVKSLRDGVRCAQILREINSYCHARRVLTVAKGVENVETLRRLEDIGVDYAQGFAIESPLWLDDMA